MLGSNVFSNWLGARAGGCGGWGVESAQDPKGVYRPIEARVLFLYCVIYFDRWRYRERVKKKNTREGGAFYVKP